MARGRKPLPPSLIENKNFKRNTDELAEREESWNKLKTTRILRVPSHLTPEAKKEWRRVIKLYEQMEVDILSDLDRQALIMYCESTAIYKKAQETWSKLQQVVSSSESAQRLLNDTFRIMERQTKIISSLSEQLCLTPVGRARMGMNRTKDEADDDFSLLMRKLAEAKD